MKQAIKINLSGLVFHIDEDAYAILKEYLDSVSSHFRSQSGGQEIIQDIESRIAELFQERINPGKQSIIISDVEQIISILGRPNEFEDEEESETTGPESSEQSKQTFHSPRRLYRDVDNAYLGGVASGLGAYFNIEYVYVRLVFIILIFLYGIGPLLYLVFWLAVPPARTTAQKLEMRGENINLDNIEKALNDEYQQVKKNFQNYRQSQAYQDVRNGLGEVIHVIGKIIGWVFKAIVFVIGLALIIGGTFTLLAVLGFAFLDFNWVSRFTDIQFIPVRDYFDFISTSGDSQLVIISLLLAIGIPVFALIYGGIKMVFRIKTNDRVFGLGLLVLWILAVSLGISLVFFEVQDFRKFSSYEEETTLPMDAFETVYIQSNPNFSRPDGNAFYWDFFTWSRDYGYHREDGTWTIYGRPDLKIRASENNKSYLVIERESRGIDNEKAIEHAQQIEYRWAMNDSLLRIDPYFIIKPPAKWREPEVDVILYVPVGKKVYLDRNTKSLIGYIPNRSGRYHSGMTGHTWMMTDDGLTLLEDHQ